MQVFWESRELMEDSIWGYSCFVPLFLGLFGFTTRTERQHGMNLRDADAALEIDKRHTEREAARRC